jgi:hypothetical protein
MQALAVVLSDIAVNSEKPNKKLLELAKRINTASISATNANDVIKLFDGALLNLGKTLENSSESSAKLTGKVEAMVAALQEQAKAIGETNRETAIRIATESKATGVQLASINAVFDKIEAVEKQTKVQKELDKAIDQSFKNDIKRSGAEKNKQGKATSFAQGVINSGQSPIERLQEEQAQLEELKRSHVGNMDIIDQALTANSKKQADLRASYQIANANLILSASSNLFGGLASLLKSSGDEQSNAYKAMFALSKGFAVAQAAMNLSLAISNASAITPWYASLPAIASVVSAGAGLASSIAGATYGGRENGGSVIGGQTYEVGEKNKPEMLMIPGNNGKVFSNSEMKSAMGGGGGGGGVPIINNYAAGNGVSVSHRRDELTKDDVFDIVQNEMTDSNSRGRRGMQQNSNLSGVLNGRRRS